MPLPTEAIGSIPRPQFLLDGVARFHAGEIDAKVLDWLTDLAVSNVIARFEQTGSPVVSDGEQVKRGLPVLTSGPFQYQAYADSCLRKAQRFASRPVKQAVIAPSTVSLIYPREDLPGYPRDAFIEDLTNESETDIRRCLDAGAASVQLDFAEATLSIKLDPSKALLGQFIDLNNRVLDRFTTLERERIGVHICQGGDEDSVHSLDVDYGELLPMLFDLRARNFYLQLASEPDRLRLLEIVKEHSRADQRIFIGVTDPANPAVETPEDVRDQLLEAAKYLPPDRLGSCDDCGFSPFADDTFRSRDTAFAKVAARVEGTTLASDALGV